MSVTLQLPLLHLTDNFRWMSHLCVCLPNDLIFELNDIFVYHNKQRCYKLNIQQYKINKTYTIIKQAISTITEPYTL